MSEKGYIQTIQTDAVREYSPWEIIRRLLLYVRPYRRMAFAAFGLSLASSVLLVIRPYLIKVAIDSYITPGNLKGLTMFMMLFVAVYIIRLFVDYFLNMVTGIIGQKVMHDLRMAVFSHILSMEMRFFDHNKVGRLMTRTTDDVASLNELYTSGAVSLVNNSGIIVCIVIIMAFMDLRLALVTLAVSPLIYWAAVMFSKKIRAIYRNIRKGTARLNAFLQESIQGVSIIKQMVRSMWANTKFSRYSDELMKHKIDNVFQYGLFFPVMEFISVIAIVFILIHSGHRIHDGTLKLGVMVAFIRFVDMFFWPVREMAENFNIMLSAMSSSERIFTLLDTKPSVTDSETPVSAANNPDIVFDHVWFAYDDDEWMLRDVSFRVAPGERVAFVGPTGSGKTTIISLLLRFYDVKKGRILIGGKDIRDIPLTALRSMISLVNQEPFLFNRSVRDNITLGVLDSGSARIREIITRIDDNTFFDRLDGGLDTIVSERGSRLSQGQRQLVSFTRALAFNRAVLILDEATSNVDTFTDTLVQKAVPVLMEGRTSIVIAHRLSTVRTVDRIYVLVHGRICESGKHSELLALNGIYTQLCTMYLDGERGNGKSRG